MSAWCRRITESRRFQNFILAVILGNAVLVGLETSERLMAAHGALFGVLNTVVLGLFLGEIVLRLLAYGAQPARFFQDGWNVFDLSIVAASLLPEAGAFATVARLARLLRVTRVISTLPELRLIVSTMLRSIPSMGNVILLLGLLLYVYGVLGVHLFGQSDPAHWGTLGLALLTLFQILTLEGWVELQQAGMAAHPWAWVYFGSFVVIAVFVVINLFIAIVINNLETAKLEDRIHSAERHSQAELLRRITELKAELEQFEETLRQSQMLPRPAQLPLPRVTEERTSATALLPE